MTFFLLILGIHVSALAGAFLLASAFGGAGGSSPSWQRLTAAVTKATFSLARLGYRRVALSALGVGAVAAGFEAYRAGAQAASESPGPLLGLAVLLGAAATCLAVEFALRLGTEASAKEGATVADKGARWQVDLARATGSIGIIVQVTGVLGLLACWALATIHQGGPSLTWSGLRSAIELAPGFALGACTAAAILQHVGATYFSASAAAARRARSLLAPGTGGSARNPAMLCVATGFHVGHTGARVAVFCAIDAVANAVLLWALLPNQAEPPRQTLELLLLVWLIRSSGLIGSVCALLVFGSSSDSTPKSEARVLRLSLATVSAVTLGGFLSAAWALLAEGQLAAVGVTVSGVLGVATGAWLARLTHQPPQKRAADGPSERWPESNAHPLAGAARALLIAPAVVALAAAAIAVARGLHLGSSEALTGIAGPALLIAALLSLGPTCLGFALLEPLASSTRGLRVVHATLEGPVQPRGIEDERPVPWGGPAAFGRTYLMVASCTAGTMAAMLVAARLSPPGSRAASPSLLLELAGGPLAVMLGLGYAGFALYAAVEGAGLLTGEVERQLRGFPRDGQVIRLPADYAPSYRACLGQAERAALSRFFWAATVPFWPLALVLVPILLYPSLAPGLVSEALASFLVLTSMTGLGTAVVQDTMGTALAEAPPTPGPGLGSSEAAGDTKHTTGELLSVAGAPTTQLFIATNAAAVLWLASHLT